MSKLYKTKGEMFNIIEQRFINFLKVNNIIIPDEYIQYDNDLKKSILKLKIKPYCDSLEEIQDAYANLINSGINVELKKSYDDIDMNVKRKALRYIQALCRLV